MTDNLQATQLFISPAEPQEGFRAAFTSDKSLACFLESLQEFEEEFCRRMFEGNEFSLRLEVNGNKNKMIHTRTNFGNIRRPEETETETRRDRKRNRKRGGDN